MAYLIADNNLADLFDITKSRTNLGLGNMSTMNSNDVRITGGNIEIDTFKFVPSSPLDTTNYMLKNSNADGSVEWFEVPSISWLDDDQSKIRLSGFCNDVNYVQSNQLASVAFSGSFLDLINIPQSLQEVYSNDVLNEFLYSACNLSDLTDVQQARSNLGLGALALQNPDNVSLQRLDVTNKLKLNYLNSNGYLYINSSKEVEMRNFTIATNTTPGIVYKTDTLINDSNFVPTSELLYKVNSNLNEQISDLQLGDLNAIVSLFGKNEYLFKTNLLSEFSNDQQRQTARQNLGLGDIATQNSETFSVSNITLSNLQFNTTENIRDKVLTFDNNKRSQFKSLDDFLATETNPGSVYIINDYINYVPDARSNVSVISYTALSNYIYSLTTELNTLKANIPVNVNDLQGNDVYLRANNNLSDLTNKSDARSNLELKKVAVTGKYSDLEDYPYNVSRFNNDVGFIVGHSNLADLNDIAKARANLGLGSMATQDINNVRISGGAVHFRHLKVNDKFYYRASTNPTGKFLVAGNSSGKMEWKKLPIATETEYGLVRITDDLQDKDARRDVVPTCRVFSEIEERITYRLLAAQEEHYRNYFTSPEYLALVRESLGLSSTP